MGFWPDPNIVDVAALALVLGGMIQGFFRGLSRMLGRLVVAVSVFILGLYACRPAGLWLADHTRLSQRPALALAFMSVCIVVTILVSLTRFLLGRIMQVSFEKRMERMGGILAGGVYGALWVTLFFIAVNLWPHAYVNRHFGQSSIVGSRIKRQLPSLFQSGPTGVREPDPVPHPTHEF